MASLLPSLTLILPVPPPPSPDHTCASGPRLACFYARRSLGPATASVEEGSGMEDSWTEGMWRSVWGRRRRVGRVAVSGAAADTCWGERDGAAGERGTEPLFAMEKEPLHLLCSDRKRPCINTYYLLDKRVKVGMERGWEREAIKGRGMWREERCVGREAVRDRSRSARTFVVGTLIVHTLRADLQALVTLILTLHGMAAFGSVIVTWNCSLYENEALQDRLAGFGYFEIDAARDGFIRLCNWYMKTFALRKMWHSEINLQASVPLR